MNSSDSSTEPTESPQAWMRSRLILFLAIASCGCLADLATKHYIFRVYYRPGSDDPPEQHWWIDGWLGIETSTNQGALFGMGQGMSGWFALLSVLALAAIVFWLFLRHGARDLVLTVALAGIAGGIVGNLYDRMGVWHQGDQASWNGMEIPASSQYAVRDWIHFRWEDGPIRLLDPWPNFNIADSLLVCGAFTLFLHAVLVHPAWSRSPGRGAAAKGDGRADEPGPA